MKVRELLVARVHISMPTIDPDAVLSALDLEPVVAAIRQEPLPDWAYEDAAKCVWAYAAKYFPGDLGAYSRVIGIEQHWAKAPSESNSIFDEQADRAVVGDYRGAIIHGYADLVFEAEGGDVHVVDWKTASELDKAWEARLADSWQWRLYCAVYGASAFLYRGVDKSAMDPKTPGKAHDWTKAPLKELRYTPREDNVAQVLAWLRGAMAMRDALGQGGPWPRRMPDACRPYGSPCPFVPVCHGEVAQITEPFVTKAFSYSGIGTFMNCPESYRLATVTGHKGSSAATALGNAVHRGIAAVYGQFGRLKETLA